MQQKKVVKKRIVTANGQVIAEATSVVITSGDQTQENNVTSEQFVEVEVSPNHATSHATSYSVVIE